MKGAIDFILCLADNIHDEKMFKMINALKRKQSGILAVKGSLKSFTCTIGRRPSRANYYVNDIEELIQVLGLLRGWSNKSKRNLSSGELNKKSKGFSTPGSKKYKLHNKRSKISEIEESDDDDEFVGAMDVPDPENK